MLLKARGNFINGVFREGSGQPLRSHNPADGFSLVLESAECVSDADEAVDSAVRAFSSWSALSSDVRVKHLNIVALQFKKYEAEIARAISLEMGKVYSESLTEAQNLSARVSLVAEHGLSRVTTEYPRGVAGETRYHAQGALTVIGPYNFPVHLVNAHVIPALMTGNTVVVKPSEACPLSGQLYAECFDRAGLPPGVFNLVQGGVTTSKKLITHPDIRGVLFTGSYSTGRAIKEMLLDHPHKQLALELGGKNFAVVLKDANLYQALSEIIAGAFLTTGQRCTATSRVLIAREVSGQLTESLCRVARHLLPGNPLDEDTIFGPLATRSAFERYNHLMARTEQFPLDALVQHSTLGGGAFVTPSISFVRGRHLKMPGYFDEEFFGPHLAIEYVDDLDDAIERINHSQFGLSNAIFTADKNNFEQIYHHTRVGVLNWNRSTNGANGQLPFGGVGMSGNQRAAGIDTVRYTTYPVAINTQVFGETSAVKCLSRHLRAEENVLNDTIESLAARHRIEALFERHRLKVADACGSSVFLHKEQFTNLLFDRVRFFTLIAESETFYVVHIELSETDNQFLAIQAFVIQLVQDNIVALFHNKEFSIHAPKDGGLPESEAWLNRLYCRQFVPREKKTAVIDLHRSLGGYLCSIDKDPLVFFDAASQIATVGVGFQAAAFRRALEQGEFNHCLAANLEVSYSATVESALHERNNFEILTFSQLLLEQGWGGLKDVTFCSSGAESNEIAFRLCCQHGPGGKRIIAFEGSFHGRTILSLQSTHSPDKRRGFEFRGYESTFIPFPINYSPKIEPEFTDEWIRNWTNGISPKSNTSDPLLAREVAVLDELKAQIDKGDICCVIIEPMQSEGGDNYATSRFYNGLRALTRGLNIPLIFDEVQTGFCLGGPFYWHTLFNLRDADGQADGPDCITLAKKAQLGAVVSVWTNHVKPAPHILQIARGRRQAEEMMACDAAAVEKEVIERLLHLQNQFPQLVDNPRTQGYAFAFDMPAKDLATGVVEQRFYRGFMSYIAGERTIRFRLNLASRTQDIDVLFSGLSASLNHVKLFLSNQTKTERDKYTAPTWINGKTVRPKELELSFLPSNTKIETITLANFDELKAQILELEHSAYEPGRRDHIDEMREWLNDDYSLGLAIFRKNGAERHLCGYALGGPLEAFSVDGPRQDPLWGKQNTFYSANIVVDNSIRGQQLGLLLKAAQVSHVMNMRKPDGTYVFDFMTGRNRIGFAAAMSRITNAFGAYPVSIHDHQYGDPKAQALYYRISLRTPAVTAYVAPRQTVVDWSAGIQMPFGISPKGLVDDINDGQFNSAIYTKLTLSNFVTPDFIRYMELVHHVAPLGLKHVYLSSGRDEMVDKAIRAVRVSRPNGELVIGFSHQFLGNSTAAARSLSDSTGQDPTFKWFDWPIIAHPNADSLEKTRAKLAAVIQQQGAQRVLAIVVELIGEHSGYFASKEFLQLLAETRSEHDIPLIFVESVSAFGRAGPSFFLSDSLPVKPNLALWYTGAQLGHVFVDDRYYVDKPLTLISTWDGDEISMRRNYQHILMATRQINSSGAHAFSSSVQRLDKYGRISGLGLWQSLSVKDEKTRDSIHQQCLAAGLILKKGLPTTLILCPPIDISQNDIDAGIEIIETVLGKVIEL